MGNEGPVKGEGPPEGAVARGNAFRTRRTGLRSLGSSSSHGLPELDTSPETDFEDCHCRNQPEHLILTASFLSQFSLGSGVGWCGRHDERMA